MSRRKKTQGPRPDGEIRRSQMVGTYGPGAMVDLLDHAVVTGGLDFWMYPSGLRPAIPETRLRQRLADRFARLDPPIHLSEDAPFLSPPAAEDDPAPWNGVQALEFPGWFVCQNPTCRALLGRAALDLKGGRYLHRCDDRRPHHVVPVRFVGACARGHLQDFPWIAFAHLEDPRCSSPRLRLDEGASGDFSEIRVTCSCGAGQPMSRARIHESGWTCQGWRPWLGRDGDEDCDQPLRLLVRTATNGYFAQVESALSIPDPAQEIEERLESVWDTVKNMDLEFLARARDGMIEKVGRAFEGFSDEDVMAAIEARRQGRGVERESIRTAELRQLRQSPRELAGEVAASDEDFFARYTAPPTDRPQVGGVVLVHKLREVRAQVGFTRLEAPTADLEGEYDLGVESQRLGLRTDWLPATEIRGEGLLVDLDEERVRAWEDREAVVKRDAELRQGFEAWLRPRRSAKMPYPGIRYYLLHSLSHLLISAISLHCGYPSASIRERLYCSSRESDLPMAAVLLSTGSAGTEGTLGGLVEEGRRLGDHLRRALDMASLCSNDPVCGSHSPLSDHAERFLEGAACHGCLYVAEPSCERFNLFLDRALVVPTLGQDPRLAFFGS